MIWQKWDESGSELLISGKRKYFTLRHSRSYILIRIQSLHRKVVRNSWLNYYELERRCTDIAWLQNEFFSIKWSLCFVGINVLWNGQLLWLSWYSGRFQHQMSKVRIQSSWNRVCTTKCFEKTKINKIEAGNGAFSKTLSL